MKLINHTLLFLSAILVITVGTWAVIFYYQLLSQVKITFDEGLANYKIILIDKLKDDSLIVRNEAFKDNNYIVRNLCEDFALQVRDSYKDTLIYSELKNKSYRTRLLTTAFASSDRKYYEIKMISQELDTDRLVREIATSLLWLFLFLLISTILINNFVLKKTWKPFYQLLRHLDDFQLDKGKIWNPKETKIKEFSLLNKSIRNLLSANVNIFNSQKQFIENASHELQTPLAIGINKLELLADQKDLAPVHIQRIGNIIEIFQRLSSLNKSLLLLSKIENRQFIAGEPLSLDEIIRKILDDFTDYSEYRKIKMEYKSEHLWFVKLNRDIANILVMNLVKNAIIHNRLGGELIITLSSEHFTIENTSDNPALNADKLFERFNRSPKSNVSTGLGLAIVKAIADASDLSVTYSYNGNHVFKVSSLTG